MAEWKKLGEVCSFNRGRTITSKNAIDGGIPVIAGGQTPSYYHNEANRKGECITIAGSGAYAGFVAYWNQPIFVSDAFTVDPTDSLLHKYLFYWLKKNQEKVFATQKGAGVPHVHGKDIAGFCIPIPTLSEQQRIVDILDTFTSSIGNLKQQIEQRRKQYEYYREKLMGVDEGPEARLITLGEIGTFERGNGIQKKDFTEEGVGCIHYGQIHTYFGLSATETISCISKEQARKCKKAHYGDIIIATTSEDVEGCAKAVAWLGNHEICISGDSLVFHHMENPKYIAYLFRLNYFQRFKRGRCTGAKVTRISAKALSEYPFVLPIRSRQAEIVSNLDTFEDSIRNLEEQLKLREKQYEYYRNKLLTFE